MRPTPHTEPGDDHRWNRLERLLARLKPGQAVTIDGVAARTGVGADSVDTVLQALTRAEMFAQKTATMFVRERLIALATDTPCDHDDE